ncbi:MoaD/ThiS family protein [Polyangium jinanense]|nr:MoaD/ThiS family protein [Polyangium jinanense]
MTNPHPVRDAACCMPRVTFTQHIARHVPCPARDVEGRTVREALDTYFAAEPAVRGYVLDEQGVVRKHVVIFVDGNQATDRSSLGDAVGEGSVIYVMQALSGG